MKTENIEFIPMTLSAVVNNGELTRTAVVSNNVTQVIPDINRQSDPYTIAGETLLAYMSLLSPATQPVLVTYNGDLEILPVLSRYIEFDVMHIDFARVIQRTPWLHKFGPSWQRVYQGLTGKIMDVDVPMCDYIKKVNEAEKLMEVFLAYQEQPHSLTIPELTLWLKKPQKLSTVYFGPHAGKHFDELPAKYIQYLRDMKPASIDLQHTLNLI